MTPQAVDMNKVREYWNNLKQDRETIETNTNRLTAELINRLDDLTTAYETERLDRERDVSYTRQMQRENRELAAAMAEIKEKMNRDASVLVLLDGDGLLFEDRYVQGGEYGGNEAAQDLFTRVTRYVREHHPNIPSDAKVLVRIYANYSGLTRAYVDAGIADFSTVNGFARGFTKAKAHFDFVDCGAGKERADTKIGAAFNLYVNNIQTRHILLGCSHDNGYARLLEELPSDSYDKVTLLEGVPFVRELSILTPKFATTKFDGLFRDSKIEVTSKLYEPRRTALVTSSTSPPPDFSLSNLMSSSPAPNGNGIYHTPYETPGRPASTSTAESNHVRPSATPSNSSPAPSPATIVVAGIGSWANKASTAASLPQTSHLQSQAGNVVSTNPIKRNRKGQRVDPIKPKEVDSDLINKVQTMKLCNNFFLKGGCSNGNQDCGHDHYYKPSKGELEALRYIARRISCVRGTGCDDPKCTAGHRCPWYQNGVCRFQDLGTCRFPPELHHSDITEVKTTLVR